MTIEGKKAASGARRIRLGMVGGGEGAFIGAVHRMAARLDDHYEFLAGALASTPEKALRSGEALGLAPDRTYPDFAAMAKAEAARSDGIEAVSIVTPNHMHAPIARAFLEAGIHVICDKPLTTTLAEARALRQSVERSGRIFALTHNYTGYPMVRQAREMVQGGALGRIRLVQAEYVQDWLSERLEATGQKQAEWRTDPARSGAGGCIGDIGTHAYNLADFITGLPLEELAADVTTFVQGRAVDDNVQIMLRYAGGAKGALWASQVVPGHENDLMIRVYGEKGGLTWRQTNPNYLTFAGLGRPPQTIGRNAPGAGAAAGRVSRIPAGHPEGYLEGFATIYSEAAAAIFAARDGKSPPAEVMFPTIEDGVKGVAFIEAALASAKKGSAWVRPEA
jgi:predicted dehydrogenase